MSSSSSSSNAVLQVGYVGSQGHRLWRFFDISQPSQAQITAADIAHAQANVNTQDGNPCYPNGGPGCISSFTACRATTSPQSLRRVLLLQENSSGKSNYNALQASLRITNWHGITSIANYVWSRSLDNSSDGEDFEPNAAQPNDSTNPQLEYGPSNFNIPKRFTWNFAYELPKMGGGMQKLKNGWGLNSILTLQNGQPFQLNYNFEDDYSGSGSGFRPARCRRTDRLPCTHPLNYLDMSSFAIPCT